MAQDETKQSSSPEDHAATTLDIESIRAFRLREWSWVVFLSIIAAILLLIASMISAGIGAPSWMTDTLIYAALASYLAFLVSGSVMLHALGAGWLEGVLCALIDSVLLPISLAAIILGGIFGGGGGTPISLLFMRMDKRTKAIIKGLGLPSLELYLPSELKKFHAAWSTAMIARGHCPKCRYEVKGLPRCPECGLTIQRAGTGK
ncbi:MAG: hypothetical protein ACF8Q5_01375 [Phycisphaerales bacterium JB040]